MQPIEAGGAIVIAFQKVALWEDGGGGFTEPAPKDPLAISPGEGPFMKGG